MLIAQGISKRFGGVVALTDADFGCEAGEIRALLGENGAGKSTMVKILCGVQAPDSGEIIYKGAPVRFRDPAAAAAVGIVPVFQESSLIPNLTVAENLWLGVEPLLPPGLLDSRRMAWQARELFATLGFPAIDPGVPVRELPLAERQLVEIAKAISRNPNVLLLDEATSALGHREVATVFDILHRLRDQGTAIVFISHRMEEVRALCDTATVFRDGRHVGSVTVREASQDQLVEMMIGRTLREVFPPRPARPTVESKMLTVDHLSWGHTLHDVSLDVRAGEILGLSGLEGQGQGDLLFALFGVYAGVSGTVTLGGRRLRTGTPAAAMRAGLALVPEDRKTQGLILPLPVGENIALPTLSRIATAGVISPAVERQRVQSMLDRLAIKADSAGTPVGYLSGGNQQKVAIAKWLLGETRVYLMYDPTRGIDVGTKQEIYRLMRQLADQGHALLFFSTDLTEIVGLCDRALVMYEGAVVRELSRPSLTEANLVSAALGMTRAANPAPVEGSGDANGGATAAFAAATTGGGTARLPKRVERPDSPATRPPSLGTEEGEQALAVRSGSQRALAGRFLRTNGRILVAYLFFAILLIVYAEKLGKFGPLEAESVSNSGMTLTLTGLGQGLVILTGGIDLSVGPLVCLTNSLAATLPRQSSPNATMALTAIVVLAVGALAGLTNGMLVAYGRLQPIIVTLATSSIFSGLALYVRPNPGGFVPFNYVDLLTGQINGTIPRSLVLLGIIVLLWFIFRRTRLGTRIYAIGGSEGAAYMSGVNVARTKVAAYTLAGLASAVAGLFFTAQTATGDALAGNVYTLNSIAAVVIGGALLLGGVGSFIGTIAGAYILSVIPSILYFYHVNSFYQSLFQGLIIILAVSLAALSVLRVKNRLERF